MISHTTKMHEWMSGIFFWTEAIITNSTFLLGLKPAGHSFKCYEMPDRL